MRKIQNKYSVGLLAGFAGNIIRTIYDEVTVFLGLSKFTCREAAAGAFLKSKKEIRGRKGVILGLTLDTALCLLGGIVQVSALTGKEKDKLPLKGALFGMGIAGVAGSMLSAVNFTGSKPKNVAGNLSFLVGGSLYGIVTSLVARKIGHPSIYESTGGKDLK